MLFAVDALAQVVGCPWTMRDSGGSLAQNRWQGDLGLTAVGQDGTGGGESDLLKTLRLCPNSLTTWSPIFFFSGGDNLLFQNPVPQTFPRSLYRKAVCIGAH